MEPFPEGLTLVNQTPEFDQDSIPAAIRKAHRTKEGVWGKIVLSEGELIYRILLPEVEENLLTPEAYGVVQPTVPHEVQAKGSVKFHVEFYSES